jgi:hypothetical protein
MLGANKSLLTLRLDSNLGIGDEGVAELAKGLRTNKTLKARCALCRVLCAVRLLAMRNVPCIVYSTTACDRVLCAV